MEYEVELSHSLLMVERIENMHACHLKERSRVLCWQWAFLIFDIIAVRFKFTKAIGHWFHQYAIIGGILLRAVLRIVTISVACTRISIIKPPKPTVLSVIGFLLNTAILALIGLHFWKNTEQLFDLWSIFVTLANGNDFSQGFILGIALYGGVIILKAVGYVLYITCYFVVACCEDQENVKEEVRQPLIDRRSNSILRVREEVRQISSGPDKKELTEMLNRLVQIRFRKSTFYEILQECPICFVEFEEDDQITPLPCDSRHYFHHRCICAWLEKNNWCPLCNEPVPANPRYSYRASMLRSSLVNKSKKSFVNNGL